MGLCIWGSVSYTLGCLKSLVANQTWTPGWYCDLFPQWWSAISLFTWATCSSSLCALSQTCSLHTERGLVVLMSGIGNSGGTGPMEETEPSPPGSQHSRFWGSSQSPGWLGRKMRHSVLEIQLMITTMTVVTWPGEIGDELYFILCEQAKVTEDQLLCSWSPIYMSVKWIHAKNKAQWAWEGLTHLVVLRYSRFLWSVNILNRCVVPSI